MRWLALSLIALALVITPRLVEADGLTQTTFANSTPTARATDTPIPTPTVVVTPTPIPSSATHQQTFTPGNVGIGGAGTTSYTGNGWASGTEATAQVVQADAKTYTQLYAAIQTAPSSGQNIAFTLRKNGADTSITCTISNTNTSCNDTAHSVAVAAGDLLDIKAVPSGSATAPGAVSFSIV